MKSIQIVSLVLAVMLAVGLAQIAHTSGQRNIPLVGGKCNPVALTEPVGTPMSVLVGKISPTEAVTGVWYYIPAEDRHEGYHPATLAASDLTHVRSWLMTVAICVSVPASLHQPSVMLE